MNITDLETQTLISSTSSDAEWSGGFFAYGGAGSAQSATIAFAIPPGKRLGRHTDTTEETQFIVGGSGELVLDSGTTPIKLGDVFVLAEGEAHDLRNTGSDDLRVLAFFAAPAVQQHWTTEVWQPGGLRVTGSPNTASQP
jgi:quercetin dioxygenase-like cupin family protein